MAWWVVLGHAVFLVGLDKISSKPLSIASNLIQQTGVAVGVFIILSGFVIAHLLETKREAYPAYIVRRFFRIYPIFLFCLMIAIAISPLYLDAYTAHEWVSGRPERIARIADENEHFGTHLVLHLSMLHGIPPEEWLQFASSSFLSPAWSLSLEWQFYLLAPAILMMFRRATPPMVLIMAAVFAAMSIGLRASDLNWHYDSFILLAMPLFVIGIASRMSLNEGLTRAQGMMLIAACALSAMAYARAVPGLWLIFPIWGFFYYLVRIEQGLSAAPSNKAFGILRWMGTNKVVSWMGAQSYSTYLIHIPLFSIFVGGAGLMLGEAFTQAQAIIAVLLAIVATIPVSAALYNWVELPFNKRGSAFARRLSGQAPVDA